MTDPVSAEEGISRCAEVIERLTGGRSRYYRPVGGCYMAGLLEAARRQGHTVALWSNLWGDDADSIIASAFDGSVLMIREQAGVKSSLPAIVDRLVAAGYRFSTLGG
jgi:peptidoglycan/xylan/chitin deacetylase (PgdA/CDA1 family)